MFGYVVVNKPEMKFKEFDVYHSYYCGLCRTFRNSYGLRGRAALNYDMKFLAILLTGLYEPELGNGRCPLCLTSVEKLKSVKWSLLIMQQK